MANLTFNQASFRIVFRAIYTVLVSVWTGLYLWYITFSPAEVVSKYAEFIIGFVLGTLISTLINYYFGGIDEPKTIADRRSTDISSDSDVTSVTHSMSETSEVVRGDDA